MPSDMGSKIAAGAVGMVSTAAVMARHLYWYVSHQMEPSPRDDEAGDKMSQRPG